ncbi:monooxygenase, partial [Cryomyces antarcticus]
MGSVSTGAARHFDVKSIAIIGAGPSGVAAAKYLRAENAFNRITIFEQRSTTGGIWNLTPSHPKDSFFNIPNTNPNAGLDKPIWQHSDSVRRSLDGESNGEAIFMSPLYERLETNIPRTLMRFSDFDFPVDAQLFPTHETVTKYLDDYAEDVKDVIVFGVQVLDVRLVGGEERSEKWRVKTKPVVSHCNRDAGEKEEIFDAVVVANG